ncbi:MAG TPA: adenylate/guanylate cyclase domain-containing protein [Opitutaceae bacterium]|nr:adenylate/guanylate cyclase domain-containing protein [Opitutaceae bacterium]
MPSAELHYRWTWNLTARPEALWPLALKTGIHCGPCLALNQNGRLDYFGSAVNVAARLCSLCTGADIVLSAGARADPEIEALLAAESASCPACAETTPLKGFPGESFEVCRLTPR